MTTGKKTQDAKLEIPIIYVSYVSVSHFRHSERKPQPNTSRSRKSTGIIIQTSVLEPMDPTDHPSSR